MSIPGIFRFLHQRTFPNCLRLMVVLCLLCVGIGSQASETPISDEAMAALVVLRSGDIELGILPKVGGSAVLFRKSGFENVLFAPADHWAEWQPHIPEPLDLSQWTDFYGHINWLGPQVDFWNQQELIPSQHDQLWPPDPYWVYGNFAIVEQSEHHVVLEGPESPFTGVKMIKTYRLDESGASVSVTAINVTDRVLKWELWSNTRVYGDTAVYIPLHNESCYRIEAPDPDAIPFELEQGIFHFEVGASTEPNVHSKAYLFPEYPWMIGVRNQQVFVKIMEKVEQEAVHPNQGVFEVYQLRPDVKNGHPGLTEMEAHGTYMELKPGDQMTLSERWVIDTLEEGEDALDWLNAHRSELDSVEVH